MAIKSRNRIKLVAYLPVISILLIAILSVSLYPIFSEAGRLNERANEVQYLMSKTFYFEMFGEIENLYSEHIQEIKFWDKHTIENYQLSTNYFRQAELTYNREVLYDRPSKNIKYVILDKSTGKWATNLTTQQKELLGLKSYRRTSLPVAYLDDIDKQVDYLWLIEVDENGELRTLYTSSGIEYDNKLYNSFCETYKIKPTTNVQLLYMIPNEFVKQDELYKGLELAKHNGYQRNMIELGLVGIIGMGLLGILVKSKNLVQNGLINKYNKLALEVKFLIILIGITCFNVYVGLSTQLITEKFNYRILHNMNLSQEIISFIVFANCILLTFIFYLVAYVIGGNIKYICKIGIKEGLVNTSWIAKYGFKLKQIFKEPYNFLKPQQIVLSLIGVNLLLSVIAFNIGTWGIVFILIYNILLAIIGRRIVNWIKYSFGKLNQVTKEMKEGNLEITIDNDLGVFNSLGEDLIKVKEGFKQAVDKEVRSERMKTELITNISHDLKTPLTSIINYVDLLKTPNLDQETQMQYINILESKSRRLKVLIEDLFEMTRAASGNINLDLQEIDLVALMNQIIGELRDKIDKSGLIFKTNFPNDKVKITLDGRCMVRVIENLIGNSIKYAMPGSRVFIDIVERQESVEVIIKNISAEEMNFTAEEIIERFNRGDTSRHTEGSGLGLAISKNLVELQGGLFEVILDGDLFKVIIQLRK